MSEGSKAQMLDLQQSGKKCLVRDAKMFSLAVSTVANALDKTTEFKKQYDQACSSSNNQARQEYVYAPNLFSWKQVFEDMRGLEPANAWSLILNYGFKTDQSMGMQTVFFHVPFFQCQQFLPDIRKLSSKQSRRGICRTRICPFTRLIVSPNRVEMPPVLQQWTEKQINFIAVEEALQLQTFAATLKATLGTTTSKELIAALAIFLRHPDNTAYLFILAHRHREVGAEIDYLEKQ